MKKLFVLLVLLTSPVLASETNFWLEPQAILNKEKNLKRIDGGLSGSITEDVGYFAFGQMLSNGYAQAYAGPTLKLSCLEAGLGLGREDGTREWRKALTLTANCGKVAALAVVENGGTGHFHKYVLTYAFSERFKLGVQEEKFLGLGPRIEYTVSKNVTLWSAVLRDRDTHTTNGVVAATISF